MFVIQVNKVSPLSRSRHSSRQEWSLVIWCPLTRA